MPVFCGSTVSKIAATVPVQSRDSFEMSACVLTSGRPLPSAEGTRKMWRSNGRLATAALNP
eukprot:CAMPEP_0119516148 /NCGR_PEP_ID=MMETSP1344-20130328/33429_1 /TAXON_ID=236787 /ORGANISM="Florenciella parvula, Strain CCMP2471" /LENGTH=60 /DNA_ID=CAMNT_0007553621 /DNA_START=17 /DNA_END=196 /DNA_ORIENTATION=-